MRGEKPTREKLFQGGGQIEEFFEAGATVSPWEWRVVVEEMTGESLRVVRGGDPIQSYGSGGEQSRRDLL